MLKITRKKFFSRKIVILFTFIMVDLTRQDGFLNILYNKIQYTSAENNFTSLEPCQIVLLSSFLTARHSNV